MTFALMAVCFAMIIDPILRATAGKMHWVVAFREVHSRLCSVSCRMGIGKFFVLGIYLDARCAQPSL
jgi:hypothetical protein